jgi:hypothetical protein
MAKEAQSESTAGLVVSASSDVFIEGATPLSEDQALELLKSHDPTTRELEQLAKDSSVMKSRKVRLAFAAHPRAPRRMVLRLIREFYAFDLMQFSLTPAAAADLRRIADELLVARLSSITLGERLALARRSSVFVAGALLLDKESRVWQAALENPRLTEVAVARALQRPTVISPLVAAVCRHAKWSVRREIRIALLRNPHTPLARALEFAPGIPPAELRDILHASRLPEKIKMYLRKDLQTREK